MNKHLISSLALTASVTGIFLCACGGDSDSSTGLPPLLDGHISSSGINEDNSGKTESSSSEEAMPRSSSNEKKSSSSAKSEKSSSSNAPKSSSSAKAPTISSSSEEIESSSSIEIGSFEDQRDGQSYNTVVIGEKTWMAQNLNYEATLSSCYDYKNENCDTYGKLYEHSYAVFACPVGWHLPSKAEWEDLITAVGGQDNANYVLKTTSGWNDKQTYKTNINGSDEYGFSALPAGYEYNNYSGLGTYTTFWAAPEYNQICSFSICASIIGNSSCAIGGPIYCVEKESTPTARSIRCVKNESEIEYENYTDTRDEQTYKTVVIGNQRWFAENLKYEYNEGEAKSYCPDSTDCSETGLYYTWAATNEICPEGWRVPSKTDYLQIIRKTVFENYSDDYETHLTVGLPEAFLMFITDAWQGHSKDARNELGLSILPTGVIRDGKVSFKDSRQGAFFWTSTESVYVLFAENQFPQIMEVRDSDGLSVRCVQDIE